MKISKNKLARELSYKTMTSLAQVLCRFSDSTGIHDVHELTDFICNLSVDQFCDFKFTDSSLEVTDDGSSE